MTGSPRTTLAHAVRVAAAAAAVIAVLYLAVVAVFDAVVVHRLVAQVDGRLTDRLRDAVREQAQEPGVLQPAPVVPPAAHGDTDVDAAPVFVWRVDALGTVTGAQSGAPALVSGAWPRDGAPTTAGLGASEFRLAASRSGSGWLVAGASLAEERHLQGTLYAGEAVAGPIVVLAMFLGSLVIGLKASSPVEQARRRQLEFTADASHELRTPLTVIEAEVDLALRTSRGAASYRSTIERVGGESRRLLRIVEDLLWLARFDSTPPPPAREPVDLATIADACLARFAPLAAARRVSLVAERRGDGVAWVNAPPEWVDRLAGVLVDNACRYASDGGVARVRVETRGSRVALVVEDDGPGIPPEERPLLFDRFHRASDTAGGTGLGLAIADSIVRSTGGRWQVGDSELGGARFDVSWRSHGRDRGAAAGRDPDALGHVGRAPNGAAAPAGSMSGGGVSRREADRS